MADLLFQDSCGQVTLISHRSTLGFKENKKKIKTRGQLTLLVSRVSPHFRQSADEESESPEVQGCLRASENHLHQGPVTPGVVRKGALTLLVPASKSLTELAKH